MDASNFNSPCAKPIVRLVTSISALSLGSFVSAQTPPQLVPWEFQSSGELVWKEQRHFETNANTVFAIARDLVTLPQVETSPGVFQPQQVGAFPEVLLCNFAQFDPPEGAPSAVPRRLAYASIDRKGLQLYVNYSQAIVDYTLPPPVGTPYRKYTSPSFFIALDTPLNTQTVPPVEPRGFSSHAISATRAAFGVTGQLVAPHSQAPQMATPQPLPPALQTLSAQVNAVYVTAAIGYANSDIDPLDAAVVDEAWRDLLLVRDASGYWQDESSRVPLAIREGNSSGVAFADFTGDGYMDLYIGMQGDNYGGAADKLLVYKPGSGRYMDETATRIPSLPVNAANEVAAADLNNDGFLDIVSVGRQARSGTPGSETTDFALINNGTGSFTVILLGSGVNSDSRSVAIGDLDGDVYPEIVIGNAGADGFSNVLAAGPGQDHPMQIFHTTNGTTYTDVVATMLVPGIEAQATRPWTSQVLLADLIGGGPTATSPDGLKDIVIVNHRDILLSDQAVASNVHILRNYGSAQNPPIQYGTAYATLWGQTVAIDDFMQLGEAQLFNGTGNRFQGTISSVVSLNPNVFFDESYDLLPGTEHGYGFDFADFNENGVIDAGQTSRGYDFLVKDVGVHTPGHNGPWHWDFTLPGWQMISNDRGRKNPRGQEDLRFEKLTVTSPELGIPDRVHAVVVGQTTASSTTPRTYTENLRKSAAVCVLQNIGSASGFKHEVVTQTLTNGSTVFMDAKIDPNGRLAARQAAIGDRVDIADMDNDGLPDVLVLYQGIVDGGRLMTIDPPEFPETPISTYMTGWSYLKNLGGPAGSAPSFLDVTATKMKDINGNYSRFWNRGQGACTVADFDNDGRMDYYTTCGRADNALNGPSGGAGGTWLFEDVDQLRDLLFLNDHAPAAAGTLTESGLKPAPGGLTILPPTVREEIDDGQIAGVTDTRKDSAGSLFVTQGDIDNDGDADVIVAHDNTNFDRTALPSLYINRLNEPGVQRFVDEYQTRVNLAGFSTSTVHSVPAHDFQGNSLYGGAVVDETLAITLADIDGDGDLDMLCAVASNAPRILRNKGADTDGNNIINASDPAPSQLGFFEDITDASVPLAFAQVDCSDIQAVDLDADGDIDLAMDAFFGGVSLWRNDRPTDTLAHVTQAWPRVGARRGATIELIGANLGAAAAVRFRVGSNPPVDVSGAGLTLVNAQRMKVQIPANVPLGLTLIQVRVGSRWSKQYMGYFILD